MTTSDWIAVGIVIAGIVAILIIVRQHRLAQAFDALVVKPPPSDQSDE